MNPVSIKVGKFLAQGGGCTARIQDDGRGKQLYRNYSALIHRTRKYK